MGIGRDVSVPKTMTRVIEIEETWYENIYQAKQQ